MREIEVKARYFLWSLTRINKPHLGDIVIYNGSEYCLIQGVSDPRWDLLEMSTSNRINGVNKKHFKLKKFFKGRFERILSSYDFQMKNWFRIDINKKIFSKISYK